MARKLLLCLLAAFAVILLAGCDNSNNGNGSLGENVIVLHPNGGVGSIEPISFNVGERLYKYPIMKMRLPEKATIL